MIRTRYKGIAADTDRRLGRPPKEERHERGLPSQWLGNRRLEEAEARVLKLNQVSSASVALGTKEKTIERNWILAFSQIKSIFYME